VRQHGPLAGHGIEVWGFEKWVSGGTEAIESMIVAKYKHDIQRRLVRVCEAARGWRGQRGASKQADRERKPHSPSLDMRHWNARGGSFEGWLMGFAVGDGSVDAL
jgi:hypothetical protein